MSAEMVFMMGDFAAIFPSDRWYAKNHMWGQRRGDRSVRFGLAAYAVRLLQDVYFLDLVIEPGMQLAARQEIGSIESKKAESGLYSPIAGEVSAVNDSLLQDPTGINLDKYESGWLFELQLEAIDEVPAPLMTIEQYLDHLKTAWEVAQRTIKGQANA